MSSQSYFCFLKVIMKKIVFIVLGMFVFNGFSQDITVKNLRVETAKDIKKEKDTISWRWKRGGLFNANLSQGSLSNWAAGGDNFSLSANAYFNYFSYLKHKDYIWDNNFDVNLGFVQTTSLGSRKNDDRFEILSKYGHSLGKNFYLSGLFNFRSQFFDGYTFGGSGGTFASSLLSPAYALLSIGVDAKPNNQLSFFASPFTSRWVIVANKFLADKGSYGVERGKKVLNELGAFASINYNHNIGKNISYKGKLDMFTNYKRNPGNIDIFFTNLVAFKINKSLSATYSLDIIYDDDVKLFGSNKNSPGTQIKSMLGIGYLLKFKPIIK